MVRVSWSSCLSNSDKYIKAKTNTDEYRLPQVVAGRGNNLHEVREHTGQAFLVSMPPKFRWDLLVVVLVMELVVTTNIGFAGRTCGSSAGTSWW